MGLLRDFAASVPGPLAAAIGFFLFMHVREDKTERRRLRQDLVDRKYMELYKEDSYKRLDRIETKLDKLNGN